MTLSEQIKQCNAIQHVCRSRTFVRIRCPCSVCVSATFSKIIYFQGEEIVSLQSHQDIEVVVIAEFTRAQSWSNGDEDGGNSIAVYNHQNHRDGIPTGCTSTPLGSILEKLINCLHHLIVLSRLLLCSTQTNKKLCIHTKHKQV